MTLVETQRGGRFGMWITVVRRREDGLIPPGTALC
jgi:hypothetical protein